MRRAKVLLVPAVVVAALTFSADRAAAQGQGGGNAGNQQNLGQLVSGLINVNVGAINVQAVDLIDVSNVLNNNQVDVLRNAIQNNPILSNNSDVLNNLLREADLITDNQIVVGVLSGGIAILNLP